MRQPGLPWLSEAGLGRGGGTSPAQGGVGRRHGAGRTSRLCDLLAAGPALTQHHEAGVSNATGGDSQIPGKN